MVERDSGDSNLHGSESGLNESSGELGGGEEESESRSRHKVSWSTRARPWKEVGGLVVDHSQSSRTLSRSSCLAERAAAARSSLIASSERVFKSRARWRVEVGLFRDASSGLNALSGEVEDRDGRLPMAGMFVAGLELVM